MNDRAEHPGRPVVGRTRRRASVPCPHCGYDLRGVPAIGAFYRCPECGGVSDLESIVRVRVGRERTTLRLVIGGLILIIIILTLILLGG